MAENVNTVLDKDEELNPALTDWLYLIKGAAGSNRDRKLKISTLRALMQVFEQIVINGTGGGVTIDNAKVLVSAGGSAVKIDKDGLDINGVRIESAFVEGSRVIIVENIMKCLSNLIVDGIMKADNFQSASSTINELTLTGTLLGGYVSPSHYILNNVISKSQNYNLASDQTQSKIDTPENKVVFVKNVGGINIDVTVSTPQGSSPRVAIVKPGEIIPFAFRDFSTITSSGNWSVVGGGVDVVART